MNKLLLALALTSAAAEVFPAIASFVPGSDVTEHAAIDVDVSEMIDALAAGDWVGAWAKYSEGGNSRKGDGFRTVRGFSKDLPGEQAFLDQKAYFGDAMYADNYIRGALWDRLPSTSSAKEGARPDFFSSTTLTDEAVVQLVKKGAVYMNTWIYSLHELYSAVKKCRAGNIDVAGGAPHAWDEYWAFYAGGLAGPDGKKSGQLSYALADKRQGNFGTGVGNQDPLPTWRSADDGANSNVNSQLLWMTRAGWENVAAGECDAAEEKIPLMINQMKVPLVQGTLRYAWKSDPKGNDETFTSNGKALAELNAFGNAVVAYVAKCNSADAELIARNIALPDVLDPADPDAVVPDGFAAVKKAFEDNYECMGITCADVGGLLDGETFVAGMEPCDDGSTVNDAADTIDALKKEFEGGGDESDGAAGVSALAGLAAAVAAAFAL
jgi:hypothetical protein